MSHAQPRGRYFGWRRPAPGRAAHFEVLVGWRWLVALLSVTLGMLVSLLRLPRQQRASALILYGATGVGAATLALLIGVRDALLPELKRIDLPLADLPCDLDGCVIAQISDLHLGMPLSIRAVSRALSAVQAARPDLIMLTGDFVAYGRHLLLLREMLRPLHAPYGIYASLGNHDHWIGLSSLSQILEELGIKLLVNQHEIVQIGAAKLIVAGVDDMWDGAPDLRAALAGAPAAPTILLAHSPDYADIAAQAPISLQLAGHSHGGHIRLPGLGALLLPRHGVRYDRGLRRVGAMWLYVSHGLGGWPLRIGCRAEATLFRLAAMDDKGASRWGRSEKGTRRDVGAPHLP